MSSGARIPTTPASISRESTPHRPIYSVRIGISYRALGLRDEEQIYWFWIGSHAEYDDLLRRL